MTTRTDAPPSPVRAPRGAARRVLLVRAVEEPVNPIYFNNMSLGLLWVAAGIRAGCPDVEVQVVDWNDLGPSVPRQRFNWYDRRSTERGPRFEALVRAWQPAVVAISAYSCYMPVAIEIAERVRACDPAIPVVLGGFHATAYPDAIGRYPMFDYFVRGDGVRVAADLVGALLDGRPALDDVRSIARRLPGGEVALAPAARGPASLDANPPVDWRDVNLEAYRHSRLAHLAGDCFLRFPRGKLVLYEASQGCHNRCRFCEQRVQHGTRSRHFGTARVLEDLRRIKDVFDPEGVFFTDEYIHGDMPWFHELLDALRRESSLGLKYTMAVKADEVDRALIDRIVDAGFVQLSSYPESGSRRILAAMGKPIDLDRHVENMAYASDQGLLVFNGFVVGWPTETREEVEMSYRIAEMDYSDHVHMLPLSYLGRAPIGRHLAQAGVVPDSPEYFRLLNHPTEFCLAAYGPEELTRYVEGRIEALNVRKLLSERTGAKLRRLGWELLRLPLDDAPLPPDGLPAAAPAAPAPEVRAAPAEPVPGDDALAAFALRFEREVLPAIADPAWRAAPGAVEAERGELLPQGRALRLRVRLQAGGAPLTVVLGARTDRPCFTRTARFDVSYQNDPAPTATAMKALDAFARRLAAWEAGPDPAGARDAVLAEFAPLAFLKE